MKEQLKTKIVMDLIKEKGMNLSTFARYIGIPYTTLLSILKSDLNSASVTNMIKICDGLNITIDKLRIMAGELANPISPEVTPEEVNIAKNIATDQKLRELYYMYMSANLNDQQLIYDIIKRISIIQ